MESKLQNAWKAWQWFWFDSADLKALGLFRLMTGLVLFVMYVIRAWDFDLFYGSHALLNCAESRSYLDQNWPYAFFFAPCDPNFLFVMQSGFLAALLAFALGWIPRLFTPILFLVHLAFLQRNLSVVYGADTVATFYLFLMCFCQHSEYWRMPFKQNANAHVPATADLFSGMGFRFLQIQVAVIYAYSGLEKLRGSTWWEGSALWYVVGNSQVVPWDLGFLRDFPWLVAVMTSLTVLFEIYFLLAILQPVMRRPWLMVGAGMHIGAAIFMGLPFFSLLMLASYVLFW